MKVLKQFFWFLMLLAMFAAAAAGGYAVYLEREDRAEIDKLRAEVAGFDPRFEKFKGAVGDLSKGFTSLVLEEADLTRAGWQPIGKGFYLVDVTTGPLDKGVRIRGKIINATAVLHEGLTFMFRIGKTSSTINIPRAVLTLEVDRVAARRRGGQHEQEHQEPEELLHRVQSLPALRRASSSPRGA